MLVARTRSDLSGDTTSRWTLYEFSSWSTDRGSFLCCRTLRDSSSWWTATTGRGSVKLKRNFRKWWDSAIFVSSISVPSLSDNWFYLLDSYKRTSWGRPPCWCSPTSRTCPTPWRPPNWPTSSDYRAWGIGRWDTSSHFTPDTAVLSSRPV